MVNNRMHARLDRKIDEYEYIKDETLAYLDQYTSDINRFIESIRDVRNIWNLSEETKHKAMNAILGTDYSIFLDERTLVSIGFWANGNHGWNLAALLKIQTELKFKKMKGFYRSHDLPWKYSIEGSNAVEMYRIACSVAEECFSEYEVYITKRQKSYKAYFDTVSQWVYEDGDYTRDYDFYVEHGRDKVKDYVEGNVLGSVRPLTY